MKNKPINNEAWGYVRMHIPENVNLNDFIIIEKFVCEMHNSFLPDGIYGDADLLKYVHGKIKENHYNIPFQLVDDIVNALYDFLYDSKMLFSITLSTQFENWINWRKELQKSIENFISIYGLLPNTINLSSYTMSQIELVSGLQNITSFDYIESVGKVINVNTLKFSINDNLIDKKIILRYIPQNDNDNDDDDFPEEDFPIVTPSPISCIVSH